MDISRTTRHAGTPCPNCGTLLDAATIFGPDLCAPSEGDISVCIGCRHILAFNADLSVRNLTDQEMLDVAGDQRLVAMIELLGAYHKEKELAARHRDGRSQAGDEEVSRQVRRQARRAAIAYVEAVQRQSMTTKRSRS